MPTFRYLFSIKSKRKRKRVLKERASYTQASKKRLQKRLLHIFPVSYRISSFSLKKVRNTTLNSVESDIFHKPNAIFFSPNPGDFLGENGLFSAETAPD
jgi:hypothetical protein